MVKRVATPVFEKNVDDDVINENGKRSGEDLNKEGKKRIKTKSLYRQPTANELNRLQETENLFNSNLFRLQVEEVLTEVKVKEKTVKRIKEWFTTFKDHTMSIVEDGVEYDLSEKKLTKNLKVKLPLSNRLQATKVMFKFHKFTNIKIVGSYALECPINSKLIIDIQIIVPPEVYTKNDSVNYKYHLKRAAYMAYVVNHLRKLDIIEELKYTCFSGSETKPLIKIKPKGKLSNISVHINFVCDTETYKFHRFSPSRNNLRESWLIGEEHKEKEIMHPTAYYNCSILADLTSESNQLFLKDTLTNSDNLQQAIVLLKIWARQRQLQVSGYILSMLVAYLVQIKRVNNIMSSYQIVRNVWIALQTSEWDTKGISLCKVEGTPTLEEFKEHFAVVFLDTSGYYNMCWQMSRGAYDALKRESSLAVDMLDNSKINSFIPLFMTPVTPLLQFDHILRFNDVNNLKASILERSPKQTRLNYGMDELTLVTDTLYSLFCKGLTKRVDLIQPMVEADITWPVNKPLDKAKQEGYSERLSFGMILNPAHALSIVDRGPPANLPEAEEFRSFWGAKSELRRFQDGAITEACVWSAETDAERRALLTQILEYLLRHKYDIPPEQQFHVCSQLNGLLRVKSLGRAAAEAAGAVLDAFHQLRRDVRALQLPLDVSALNGISPVFSYCEPAPPGPAAPARRRRAGGACLVGDAELQRGVPYVPAHRAVIELTHSGKWPGDLEAFRCLKAAFHLQIADRLRQQYSLVAQAFPSHLDVVKSGLVFRLEVAHPKEVTLLRRRVEAGVVTSHESEESVELQRRTVLLPRLRGALHGLHSKYPAFGPTACLVRRWAAAHLLAPPLSAPLSELLAAAAFVRPEPLHAPAQPTLAFLRVLRLLADTDWSRQMLLIDFNDDMTREEISHLERDFTEREQRPAMHVVTSYDGELAGAWSAGVRAQHLARARALARATADYLQRQLAGMQHNLLGAFVPSLAGYDVLLHLRREHVPRAAERLDAPPPEHAPREEPGAELALLPVVEFDPVQRYLCELRHAYGQWAVFFHDEFGGDVIAVLWTERAHERTELQILNANGLRPVAVDGETKYELNKEALVEDWRLLGAGLVARVEVCG